MVLQSLMPIVSLLFPRNGIKCRSFPVSSPMFISSIPNLLHTPSTHSSSLSDIERLSPSRSLFNITVFGRTAAGKSTLMEILTKGDGKSIGHGGQRTTRDVRPYTWNGMSVTDVPGIEAYGGDADDELAEAHAVYADLILFLARTSNPSNEEAQWYLKLQKKDKPIICVFNFNCGLHENSKALLAKDLQRISAMKSDSGVQQAISQFKQFLGNQQIDDVVVHLLSAYKCQKEPQGALHDELKKVSNFSELYSKILSTVTHGAPLYRRRCFLSIVDAPVFEEMSQLFTFSTMQYDQSAQVYDTKQKFYEWEQEFNNRMLASVRKRVSAVFDELRDQVQGFVEDYVESEDASGAWERRVKSFGIEKRMQRIMADVSTQCQNDIQAKFKALERQLKMSVDLNQQTFFQFNGGHVTDWKNGINKGTSVIGAGLGVAVIVCKALGLAACGPLGLVVLGVSFLGGFFSWLCDSHEDKLNRQKEQLAKKLQDSIYKMERNAQDSMFKCYKENIFAMQNKAKENLKSLNATLMALTNSERKLAIGLCKNHVNLSGKLVSLMLQDAGLSSANIVSVARIPAKRCCVVVRDREAVDNRIVSVLGKKLGNGEDVRFVESNPAEDVEVRARKLLGYFKVPTRTCHLQSVDNCRQQVLYIEKKNYSETEQDSILLTEQIVLTHIIPKSYGRN